MPEWRNLVCGVVFVIVPASLMAQDSGRAMLHNDGGTWLNGISAPNSTAIFLHDRIQTQEGNTAKVDAEGSTVTVQPDTVLQFEGDELALEHGSLQLTTSRSLRVRVNCITVTPVSAAKTQYDVTAAGGKAKVVAYKMDVKIHSQSSMVRKPKPGASSDAMVREGEQATRDEQCEAPERPGQGVAAKGPTLDSRWAIGAGVAIVGTLACLGLCHGDDPISPAKP